MNERIITTGSMQADHQTWRAARAQWLQDIDRWQAEHKSAVARLAEMQKTVHEHGESLEEHAKALRKIEEAIAAHEREITKQFSGSNEQPHDVFANRHQDQEGVFSRQQDAHNRIKQHHEGVMAQLNALEASAVAPM
jgi:predicted  nucleic acid-binding Zn-ribbon protein